jgi:hypothetical protein
MTNLNANTAEGLRELTDKELSIVAGGDGAVYAAALLASATGEQSFFAQVNGSVQNSRGLGTPWG